MKNDPKRESGRTTGLMLQALGKAVENPGVEVEFINHNSQNHAQQSICKKMIEDTAKKLNLDVSVMIRSNKLDNSISFGIFVKSNWVSPYAEDLK